MEPKLKTIWSDRFLNDVAYSNYNKNVDLIRVKKNGTWEDLSISGNATNEIDFEQTSWNTNSKLFEAAVCWTMCLTVPQPKKTRFIGKFKQYIRKSNDLQIPGIASNEVDLKQT